MGMRDILFRETEELPTEKLKEVVDFVRFLKTRNEDRFWEQVSESSLATLWDSPDEDEAWKNV